MVRNIIKKHDSKGKKELKAAPAKHPRPTGKPEHAEKGHDAEKEMHTADSPLKQEIIDKAPEATLSLKDIEAKILEKYDGDQKADAGHAEDTKLENDPEKADAPEDRPLKKEKNEEHHDQKGSVEAVLFASGKYVDEESIMQLCGIDKRNLRKILDELRKDYDSRDTALMITQEGDKWKINVREKHLSLVRKIVADTELSKSVMETLAVIAWKSPAYQNDIVKIRGNKCYDHIEELVNAGFVTKDKKGRSYVLKTTEKFYKYFDIDQANLKGVMNEAKIPTVQSTLEEVEKPVEQGYSREKLLHALETIETKSIVYTEEEKDSQKQFLDQIHKKIEESSRKTDEAISDIPLSMHQQEQNAAEQNDPDAAAHEADAKYVVEKEEDIVINTDVSNGDHHFQKAETQPNKPKQLTRKQLEKKFKDELNRVKDKSSGKDKKE